MEFFILFNQNKKIPSLPPGSGNLQAAVPNKHFLKNGPICLIFMTKMLSLFILFQKLYQFQILMQVYSQFIVLIEA